MSAAAKPRRRIPWRMNHSTAGLRASARKTEIRIHVMTCLEIQITSSTTATAMIVPRIDEDGPQAEADQALLDVLLDHPAQDGSRAGRLASVAAE